MKKNLILTTALFAGTMFISNDICANNILNQNSDQEDAAENLQEPILDGNHEQTELNCISHLISQLKDIKSKIKNVDGKIFSWRTNDCQKLQRDFVDDVIIKLLNLKINDNTNVGDIFDAYLKNESQISHDIISKIAKTISNNFIIAHDEWDECSIYMEFYTMRVTFSGLDDWSLIIRYPNTNVESNCTDIAFQICKNNNKWEIIKEYYSEIKYDYLYTDQD